MAEQDGKSSVSPSGNAIAKENANEQQKLPPLSPKEFRIYNRMAEQMDQFHNHHRLLWTQLLDSCPSPDTDPNPKSNPKSKSKLSPRQLITTGLHFTSGLTLHHTIEEQHIFPVLARKMPQFRTDLVAQHRAIHAGLGKLETYLERCRGGEADLDRGEVRRIMDSFGGVLWAHLDDEVRALGAENMRLYWTVGEMGGLPM